MTKKMKELKKQIDSLENQILESQKGSEDVFDTLDLIMDMDDVKDELRGALMAEYREVPQKMEQLVRPIYVITHQPLLEDCL